MAMGVMGGCVCVCVCVVGSSTPSVPLTVFPLVSFGTGGAVVVIEALRHAAGAEASPTTQKKDVLAQNWHVVLVYMAFVQVCAQC